VPCARADELVEEHLLRVRVTVRARARARVRVRVRELVEEHLAQLCLHRCELRGLHRRRGGHALGIGPRIDRRIDRYVVESLQLEGAELLLRVRVRLRLMVRVEG